MARVGRGPTLGDAIIDALRPLRRRPALSWHAQLAQLTASARGQEILARRTSHRNWLGWLSEERTPTARSREAIESAYVEYLGRSPAGRIDHGSGGEIHGEVAFGNKGRLDLRERGNGVSEPLRIDHAVPPADWSYVDAELLQPNPRPARVEDAYIYGVIAGSIDFSEPPWFPGPEYMIVVV